MKNIELTEDHKSKLLKMCKVLFPEVKIHTGVFSDGSRCPEYVLESPMDLEWGTEWNLPYISVGVEQIHWFEFCMTHLISKIQNLSNKQYLINICGNINLVISDNSKNNFKENHPIDYLYNEFKKISI